MKVKNTCVALLAGAMVMVGVASASGVESGVLTGMVKVDYVYSVPGTTSSGAPTMLGYCFMRPEHMAYDYNEVYFCFTDNAFILNNCNNALMTNSSIQLRCSKNEWSVGTSVGTTLDNYGTIYRYGGKVIREYDYRNR